MRLRLREHLLWGFLAALRFLRGRPLPAGRFQPDCVDSILAISSTALGDTVLSTAALAALKQRYPRARLVVLALQAHVPLIGRLPEVDRVIPYYGGYRRFCRTARALRQERPDVALVLHGNEPQATPLAILSGAPFVFKLPNRNRFRRFLSNPEPLLDWAALGHGLKQRLAVAALADAREPARMHLAVSEDDRQAVVDWLHVFGTRSGPLIGFQAGASSRARMWPATRFVELAQLLEQRYPGVRIVLTGSPAEATACDNIARAIGPTAAVSAGVFPLDRLPALAAGLDVLVTGDTGTMHVAVAVGTPVVALFAVSDPARSGPAQDPERHWVIYRPCTDHAVTSKSHNAAFIARIQSEDVLAGIERLLSSGGT